MHCDRLNPFSASKMSYLDTSFEIWFSKSDSESNKSSSDSDDAITLKHFHEKNHENHLVVKQSWNVLQKYIQ